MRLCQSLCLTIVQIVVHVSGQTENIPSIHCVIPPVLGIGLGCAGRVVLWVEMIGVMCKEQTVNSYCYT